MKEREWNNNSDFFRLIRVYSRESAAENYRERRNQPKIWCGLFVMLSCLAFNPASFSPLMASKEGAQRRYVYAKR
jgi:hypothetical protein